MKTPEYIRKAIKSMMGGMDPAEYAVQESWDIQTANQALTMIAGLVSSEINEPDDIAKLTAIMVGINGFIAGEIAELAGAATQVPGDSDMGGPKSINADELVYFGGQIKALGNGKVGGYLVRFSDAKTPDLTGDYFTAKSDIRVPAVLDVYYNHGMDTKLKKRVIGAATTKTDDVGIWADTQLNMRDEYEKAIYAMAESGKLGYSSGALSHVVEREPVGKGVSFIKTWAIGEASLTPTPAEPRNTVMTLKSLTTSPAALPATEDKPSNTKTKKDKTMEADEIKKLVAEVVVGLNTQHEAEIKAKADADKALADAREEGRKLAEEEFTKKFKGRQGNQSPANIKNLGSDSDEGVGAFKSWLAGGETNSELISPADRAGWEAHAPGGKYAKNLEGKAAFNVTTGASGSFLVPDPLYNRIIAKRQLMSFVRQAPIQTFQTPADHILVPVEATKATSFVLTAEAAAYDENEPTVNQVDLILYKYTKMVKMSEEFINYEGTNFDQWIADVFSRAEAATENTLATTGTGTSQPLGVNTSSGATTGNTVTTSAVLVPGDFTALVGLLGAGYNVEGQVGFLMQNATKWYAMGLQTTGFFAFMPTPSMGPSGDYPQSAVGRSGFLGYPAYISDDMDAYTVASSSGHSLIFGNWNFYGLAEKPGLLIQRNPYLYMANGQVALFATMYRGAATLQQEAFYRTVGK